jgi:hypothetical protein
MVDEALRLPEADPSIEDLSQDLDDLELRAGGRRSKKRRLVHESDDDLEVSEKMELSDVKKGISDYYQKSSAEQSQIYNQKTNENV